MQLISLLIISIAVAVITFYAAVFFLQIRRTLATANNFTAMLDSSLAPLLKELKTLSARINALSTRVDEWKKTAAVLKASVRHIAVAAEAIAAAIALRKIAASGQSKPRMVLSALNSLRRR